MARQKSQPTSHKSRGLAHLSSRSGTLYIVGMPIGTPDDLTIRARKVLRRVSVVAAETPLATQALFAHHGIINARLTSYGPNQYEEKIPILLAQLAAGRDVALVSDNGMPVIFDPGRLLIEAAHAAGHRVSILPGPSALTAAVALSGHAGDHIIFHGRLPQGDRVLRRFFAALKRETATTVLFVSPHVLPRILYCLSRVLPDRPITLAVDMTKHNEGLYHGRALSLLQQIRGLPKESEVTMVLRGMQRKKTIARPRQRQS